VTTLVLFVYTVGLRFATISRRHHRERLLSVWRDVFTAAALDSDVTSNQRLPIIRHGDDIELLEEWNRARSIVDGKAVDNLIDLAKRTGIPEIAKGLFVSKRIRSRILAIQTIGHLKLPQFRDRMYDLLHLDNTAISITAAAALFDIDPDSGVAVVIPMINMRRDWPKTRISIMLRQAGSVRVSEPLYRAIRSEDDDGKTYLLQFARLMESEVLDALVEELIRDSRNPGVLNAALKLVSGYASVPRIASLTRHESWFVRMQAAKVLGRVGQVEHLSLLESLLDDEEWWVRYRAAQAITSLPFLGPNKLRELQQQQSDSFAVDILQQCFAEVGLA
jgi:hypothetical protein